MLSIALPINMLCNELLPVRSIKPVQCKLDFDHNEDRFNDLVTNSENNEHGTLSRIPQALLASPITSAKKSKQQEQHIKLLCHALSNVHHGKT